ncbi:unnamed protein product [Caenorhabditis sp. 36 PRJEB53466]|nr:unnamed protein product [Caenorhabditis sp. 36 PRJEB53466]
MQKIEEPGCSSSANGSHRAHPHPEAKIEHNPFNERPIWNRVCHEHIASARKIRSLLLVIASNLVAFIENIVGVGPNSGNPAELLSKIILCFVQRTVEQESYGHENFLEMLFDKFPGFDPKGMKYQEVYISIAPMIDDVNWFRMKFDRRDSKEAYGSLAKIIHVYLLSTNFGVTRSEADQLLLAIYMTSVWCAILRKNPTALQRGPIVDNEDLESYIESWIFDPFFKNFYGMFVASCVHIIELGEQHEKKLQPESSDALPQVEHVAIAPPPGLGEHHSLSQRGNAVPVGMSVHPTWNSSPYGPGTFDQELWYGSGALNPQMIPQQTYPHHAVVQPCPPFPYNFMEPGPSSLESITATSTATPKAPRKRKNADQTKFQALPSIDELTNFQTSPSSNRKKGPKPGRVEPDSSNRGGDAATDAR